MPFDYVYVLQSEIDSDCYYVGLTDNLHDRLKRHNAGEIDPKPQSSFGALAENEDYRADLPRGTEVEAEARPRA